MNKDIDYIMHSEVEIENRVKEIGKQISEDYKGTVPVLVCILKGASIFMADLIRAIDIKCEIDFMSISSYGNSTKSSGVVRIKKDLDVNISGRDVIIVEDIIDSGLSLEYLKEYMEKHNPKSLATCVLLDKPAGHKVENCTADYICFDIANEFVVGYGLDFAQQYRNLPYIGVLKEEIYS